MQPTGFSSCTLIAAKLTVKPYDRQVVLHHIFNNMKGVSLESQVNTILEMQHAMVITNPSINNQSFEKTLQCGSIGTVESVRMTNPRAEGSDDENKDEFLSEFTGSIYMVN